MDANFSYRQAAMFAAGDAVTSRFAIGTHGVHRRGHQPGGLAEQLRPVPLHAIPNLLPPPNGGGEDSVRKLERYYTAASLYTLERKKEGLARLMLQDGELAVLDAVADYDARFEGNGTCSYCRMLNGLLYYKQSKGGVWIPPVESINHAARVSPSFNPDTNVSDVVLDRQQWLVRGPVRALQMLLVLHPLLWHETAPDLFKASDPASIGKGTGFQWELDVRDGETFGDRFIRWTNERLAKGDSGYIWEIVGWQWNDNVSADVQNIIRIDHLKFGITKDSFLLDYAYALEECLQSSFGVAFEPTGLDVDGGSCTLSAKPVSRVIPDDVKHLTARDLVHLGVGYGAGFEKDADTLYGWARDSPPHRELETQRDLDDNAWGDYVRGKLRNRAAHLQEAWGEEPWLVTSTLTKRFRFTAPINSPIDLWSALTYSAPALLVMFMNRAVSLPAQLIATDNISPEIKKLADGIWLWAEQAEVAKAAEEAKAGGAGSERWSEKAT